jgi:hypothetical protein
MRRRSCRSSRGGLVLPLLLLASACQSLPTGGTPGGAADRVGKDLPLPQKPFFNGAFLGDAVSNPEQIAGAIRDFGALVGKQPALVKTFQPVSCDFSASGWCGRVLRQVASTGATNFVALDPRWNGAPKTKLLEALNAGAADAELTRIARQLAQLDGTVLVEPAWEMNGNWSYAWQGVENGADPAAPARFVAAWRRMVDVFRREGATNVRWVFNPNVGNPVTRRATGASHWNWYANYYPGDAYVDYVGAHGFNAPRLWGGEWNDFATMTDGAVGDHMLSDLARRYPDKPIILGEIGTDEGAGDAKARWIRGAFERMRAHPRVVGTVWFHMNKEADWRVNSSPAALQAYRDAMRDPVVQTAFRDVAAPRGTRLASR